MLRRLGGGIASATHLIAIEGGRRVVVKRYPPESQMPAIEWEGLCFAREAALPAPVPLALDQEGSWFGTPAIAMEVLPGRADLAPKNLDRYVNEVARALVELHAAPIANAAGALRRAHSVEQWVAPDVVPDGLLPREVAERIVELLIAALPAIPRGEVVFNHSDFHPGNLLWLRGRLSGIVDWAAARIGWRWWEVAYFRMELSVLADVSAADELLRRYEQLAGASSDHQWVWDLVCLYSGHRWGHQWLLGYQEQGRRDLTVQEMSRRLRLTAGRVLADAP